MEISNIVVLGLLISSRNTVKLNNGHKGLCFIEMTRIKKKGRTNQKRIRFSDVILTVFLLAKEFIVRTNI